jgi:hypothetical protein
MKTTSQYLVVIICLLLSIFLFFYGCHRGQDNITGYIVCKEYIKSRGVDKEPEIISEAVVVPTNFINKMEEPESGVSQFKLWVANKNETQLIHIDSATWFSVKCGQKVTVKRYQNQFNF